MQINIQLKLTTIFNSPKPGETLKTCNLCLSHKWRLGAQESKDWYH